MKSAWMHHFNESWVHACTVLRVLHHSLRSSSIKPKTWLFMFLKPSKPINPKQWNQNHMNQTHVKKKKSNPSNPATDQMIKPNKRNQSNGSTQQTESIKPSKSTANQPIHRHQVPNNPSNPLPINPSTTTEFPNQTHQTRYQSTHPPPPSSQIKKLKH